MTERNGAALLSLKEVHRHYVTGDVVVRALDGIDLDVQEGEVVMLLGPSGSGKTTLLNVVSALDSPTSGTYHFDGELVPSAPEENKPKRISIPTPHPALRLLTWLPEAIVNLIMWLIFLIPHYLKHTLPRTSKLEKMTEFRRENVGYVFQFFNLLGDLTALENVTLWHERDISHSSAERVILPDACIALDYMLWLFTSIAREMRIYPKRMAANVEMTGGLIYSQGVMLALVQAGLSRQDAYERVQMHALDAWDNGGNFKSAILNDDTIQTLLTSEEVAAVFSPDPHLHWIDSAFKRMNIPDANESNETSTTEATSSLPTP